MSMKKFKLLSFGIVVTKNIPQGVIAVGNLCQVIHEITEADKDEYKRGYK